MRTRLSREIRRRSREDWLETRAFARGRLVSGIELSEVYVLADQTWESFGPLLAHMITIVDGYDRIVPIALDCSRLYVHSYNVISY